MLFSGNNYYLLCAKSNSNAFSLNVTNFLLVWFQVKLNSSEVIQDTNSIDAFLDYLGKLMSYSRNSGTYIS